jgi:hypothetical protein
MILPGRGWRSWPPISSQNRESFIPSLRFAAKHPRQEPDARIGLVQIYQRMRAGGLHPSAEPALSNQPYSCAKKNHELWVSAIADNAQKIAAPKPALNSTQQLVRLRLFVKKGKIQLKVCLPVFGSENYEHV